MPAHLPWRDEVFARLGEGLVVQAADGRIIDCNASAERILGLSYDQLTGRTSLDGSWAAIHEDGSAFPGEDHPAMVVLRTGQPVRDVVMGVHRPDDSYAWILINAEPLSGGSEAAVAASFTDITGEKERAADRLRATVDSLLDPHILYQPVRGEGGEILDMRYVEVNDAAATFIARSRQELLGAVVTDIFPAQGSRPFLDDLIRVAQTGRPYVADDLRIVGPERRIDVRVVRVGQYISASWKDVTERTRAAERLAASEELFRAAMESAVTGVGIADYDGHLTVVNDAFCAMVQRDAKDLFGLPLPELATPEFADDLRTALRRLQGGHESQIVIEGALERTDGSSCWVQAGLAILRSAGDPRGLLVQLTDITGEHEAREALQYQAFHDALTGLRNRASLLDMLGMELRAARRKATRVGVLFLDLDNFKIVNDSLGHAAGDEILKTVADRLHSVVRPRDHASRFGGDEFVVLVTDIEDSRALEVVAERVLNAIADEIVVQEHRILPTASIGLALSHGDSTTESLLREADAALFRAKDGGRSRWQFFDEQMHAQALERMTMESQIRSGLERGEFVVHYQPIVSLATHEIESYEALVRWNHPTRGLLTAAQFVPAAELSGAIVPLGETVLEQVVELLAARPDLPPVSINVSAVQLAAPRWMATFLETLGRRDVDAGRVVIEVTETAVLSLLGPTTMDLVVLQEYGVALHVDDFGTGFSSISLLRELPVTGLKIDAQFVHDLTVDDSPSNALSEGLAGLARGLDLISVAEGIETEDQARLLTEQGWTHGQGYLSVDPVLWRSVIRMDVRKVAANGIELAYETFGDPDATPMLLIMGLGTQMIAWPDKMCADLAARGHYVVRYDNRDTGLSSHMAGLPAPSFVDVTVRRRRPPYTIEDMAADAAGLMDALDLADAHIVGASMGGFIAQTLAVAHPDRIRSMTLIMTSTGSRRVGNPKPAVFSRLTKRRVVSDRNSAQQAAVETFRIIGSKGYAFDEDYLMHLGGVSYDRGLDGRGYMRQLAAIAGQPDRTARLRRLRIPTLVIHGLHDPLVAPSGGLAIARHLPNAKFVGYSGMGHDLPRELWPDMVEEIGRLAARADGDPAA